MSVSSHLDETRLEFNVVMTPGAFSRQSLLLATCLRELRCSLRLVSNGCEPSEVAAMKEFCEARERVELLCLPFREMRHHGHVLSYLQELETSPFFCFMDPDLLATGNFLPDVLPLLGRYGAVFCGRPVWQEEREEILPEDEHRVLGRYTRSRKGVILGCSYFAIYRNCDVERVRDAYGVGFERKHWHEIPPRVRLLLVKAGLRAEFFDTGKVLNVLLQEAGVELVRCEPRHLHHIGGLSCRLLRRGAGTRAVGGRRPQESVKNQVNGHFEDLLDAIAMREAPPAAPSLASPEVTSRLLSVRQQLLARCGQGL